MANPLTAWPCDGSRFRRMSDRWWRAGSRGISLGIGRVVEPIGVLFGNRSLTWMVTAFAALTVAEWGYVTALAVDAFRHDGTIAVGLVGFRLFFAAIGSLFNSLYIARRPTGRVLTTIATTRAAIVGLSAALAASGAPFLPLLALVAVDAVVASPYRPAQAAMVPSLARTPRELAACSAGISTVKTLSQAIGAIAGGFLLVVITPAAVFAGAAVVLLGAGVLTVRFARTTIPIAKLGNSGRVKVVLHDTLAVVRHPHVSGLLVVSGLRTFVRGMWLAIAVIASLHLLHAGSGGVGLLMMAAGIGALTAVPVSATLIDRPRLGTPAAVALSACGIPFIIIAGVPSLDAALVLVVVWGVGMAVSDVATSSLLYRLLDTPILPRVTGAIESAKLALEGLGALLAPVLVSIVGIRGALIAAGVPLPVVVLAGWRMLHRLDATADERTSVIILLHAVPCLEPLDVVALESLAGRAVPITVAGATEVVRQGDSGDCFYVVRDGFADVLVDGFTVGSVAPGGYFGEKALLRDAVRTATVRSRQPMHLLGLSRDDFLTALTGQSETTVALEASGAADFDPEHWNRRDGVEILSRVSLFSQLDEGELRDLAERCELERWAEGGVIVRQGDIGVKFYILLNGKAAVRVDGAPVGELHPGDQFGEIALVHDVPRRADVIAAGPALTLSLHRDDFLPAVRSQMLLG
jgi:CRP-like cAMP-binding protein